MFRFPHLPPCPYVCTSGCGRDLPRAVGVRGCQKILQFAAGPLSGVGPATGGLGSEGGSGVRGGLGSVLERGSGVSSRIVAFRFARCGPRCPSSPHSCSTATPCDPNGVRARWCQASHCPSFRHQNSQTRHGLGPRGVPMPLATTRHGLLPAGGSNPSALTNESFRGSTPSRSAPPVTFAPRLLISRSIDAAVTIRAARLDTGLAAHDYPGGTLTR